MVSLIKLEQQVTRRYINNKKNYFNTLIINRCNECDTLFWGKQIFTTLHRRNNTPIHCRRCTFINYYKLLPPYVSPLTHKEKAELKKYYKQAKVKISFKL